MLMLSMPQVFEQSLFLFSKYLIEKNKILCQGLDGGEVLHVYVGVRRGDLAVVGPEI